MKKITIILLIIVFIAVIVIGVIWYQTHQGTTAAQNDQTSPQAALGVSASASGVSMDRAKTSADGLGDLIFTNNSSNPMAVNKLTITFSGSDVASGASAFLNSVHLLNSDGVNVAQSDGAVVSVNPSAAAVTWTFGQGFNGLTTGAGASALIVPANSQNFVVIVANTSDIPAQANVAESLSAEIMNPGDIQYSTINGTDLNLSTSNVPLTINSVRFLVGQ